MQREAVVALRLIVAEVWFDTYGGANHGSVRQGARRSWRAAAVTTTANTFNTSELDPAIGSWLFNPPG
jgi:hypothetical protein